MQSSFIEICLRKCKSTIDDFLSSISFMFMKVKVTYNDGDSWYKQIIFAKVRIKNIPF